MEFTAGPSTKIRQFLTDTGCFFARDLGIDDHGCHRHLSPYKGGHNHMVDRIDALPSGLFDENWLLHHQYWLAARAVVDVELIRS